MGFMWLGFCTSLSFSSLQIRDPKGIWDIFSLILMGGFFKLESPRPVDANGAVVNG